MKIIPASFLMTIPLLLAPSAFAQHQTLVVDPAASGIAFTLGDVLHSLHGTFHLQSGTVDFESGAPKISGIVVVAAGSGESGNESRDQKMHKDVLDVSRFANVTFAPKSYQGTIAPAGDSTIQVTGAFTLHGTQHELTVPMQIHIEGTNCTAKTHFTIPYVKWGLKDPSNFLLHVGKEVEIDLTLIGRLSSAT